VTARDDARYRLRIAEQLLARAREDQAAGRWREAALFARASIENATKAVVACFGAVPRTHEPAALLSSVLADPRFPPSRQPAAAVLAPRLAGYGMAEHIMLSYGDERNRVDPWSLVTEQHARDAVSTADEAQVLAAAVIHELFPA
jgi:HEPN domain-containing protein